MKVKKISSLRRIEWIDWLIDLFFFSSRRRHTRSLCDWSSDVCSSDLPSSCLPNHLLVLFHTYCCYGIISIMRKWQIRAVNLLGLMEDGSCNNLLTGKYMYFSDNFEIWSELMFFFYIIQLLADHTQSQLALLTKPSISLLIRSSSDPRSSFYSSRYSNDFHEIKSIGSGGFGSVFKVREYYFVLTPCQTLLYYDNNNITTWYCILCLPVFKMLRAWWHFTCSGLSKLSAHCSNIKWRG